MLPLVTASFLEVTRKDFEGPMTTSHETFANWSNLTSIPLMALSLAVSMETSRLAVGFTYSRVV